MMDLVDKVIVVTGGASGIGLSTVKRLLELQAVVAVGDIAAQPSPDLQDNIFYRQLDVSNRGSAQAFMSAVVDRFSRIDGLVSNAGICPNEGEMASDDIYERVMAVNLRGVWNMGTGAIKIMVNQPTKGVIVNTASDAALKGVPGLAAYTASKHGVLGLTRAWCKEWTPKGIRINAVAPGVTNTPMVAQIAADHANGQAATRQWLQNIPMARFGDPTEIASVICFLLSKDASYMSGQVVRIGGGEGE